MRLAPFLVAAGAGLAQAAAIAAPWNGVPMPGLQILSLALLVYLLRRESSWRRGVLLGWVFAIAWLTGTFWWLFVSMHVYGGLASPLAVFAVVGLAAFLGTYYAAAAGIFVARRPSSASRSATLFAGAWLLAELMRARWFTGFPWGAGGYAHVDGPFSHLAPWVGVYGIGLVASFTAACLAMAVELPARRGALVGLVVAVAVVTAASLVPADPEGAPAGGRLTVALLQGNIAQEEKFQGRTGIPDALAWYRDRMIESPASLVVTPETALPLLPRQLPPGYLDELQAHFGAGSHAVLVGLPLGSFEEGYTNSVIGIAPGAAPYRFDKHHLVPFGEFIPPLFKWFTRMMNIPLGDFNRGPLPQPPFAWAGQRIAPNICYEDLFGEEIAQAFGDAASAPTLLANMSNIGWFGDTIAIDQHLHISRMRALEFDRPVVRATNTGATAIIDRDGKVRQLLPRLTRGVLTGEVAGRSGITPFAAWASKAGTWPLWATGLLLVAVAGWRAHRRP